MTVGPLTILSLFYFRGNRKTKVNSQQAITNLKATLLGISFIDFSVRFILSKSDNRLECYGSCNIAFSYTIAVVQCEYTFRMNVAT